MNHSRTFLVSGALGHIGSRLIRSLPLEFPECRIIMIDNLSTQRFASLFHLPKDACYKFIEGDVTSLDLDPWVEQSSAVIHLAAITNAEASVHQKELVETVNFSATQNIASACLKYGRPLIFPSTTSVYGSQGDLVDENCPEQDLKPQSPYAETKLKEENLLTALGEKGLQFVCLRLGTIFGISNGMRFHTAINKFCWQASQGLPVSVWRTALHQLRPYLDLIDAVRAMEFIIKYSLYDGQKYNILTLNTSVHEILKIIATKSTDLTVNYVDSPIMNQLSYHVSHRKFQNLGFEFSGDLMRGIFDTLQLLSRLDTPVELEVKLQKTA